MKVTYACTRDSGIAICSVSKNMGVAVTYMLNIIYSQTILVIKMGWLTILMAFVAVAVSAIKFSPAGPERLQLVM